MGGPDPKLNGIARRGDVMARGPSGWGPVSLSTLLGSETETVIDANFSIIGSGDASKKLKFEVDAQTTGKTLTVNTGAQTADRTATMPVLAGAANVVVREAALTDNAVTRADGTTGKIQDSGVIVDDSNNVTGVVALTLTGPAVAGTAPVTDATTNAQVSTPNVQANGTSSSLGSLIASRWVNSSGPPAIFLAKSRGAAVNTRAVVANADILGRIAFDGDDGTTFREAARIEALIDEATPSSTAMGGKIVLYTTPAGSVTPAAALTIDNAKLATFAGNVVVTTGKTITAVSGIIFSNETLSQYDEGTWTPTLYGDGTAGTPTYAVQAGTYTRIGNFIRCLFHVAISANTGMVGNLRLGGLPFTVNATYDGQMTIGYQSGITYPAAKVWMSGFAPANQVYVDFWCHVTAAASAKVDCATGVAASTNLYGMVEFTI